MEVGIGVLAISQRVRSVVGRHYTLGDAKKDSGGVVGNRDLMF